MQPTIDISVPTAHLAPEAKTYTLYDISIKLPLRHLTIPKRYSEFVALDRLLTEQAEQPPPTSLPPKHYFSSTAKSASLTENRRAGLEAYLQAMNTAADPRWRSTAAWRTFLNLGSASNSLSKTGVARNGRRDAEYGTPSSDPVVWLDVHRQLKAALRDARLSIAPRTTADGASAGQESNTAAKSALVKASALLADLNQGLTSGREDWGRGKLGEGELRRRKDLLAAAGKEKEDLENLMLAMAQKRELDDVVGRSRGSLQAPHNSAGRDRPSTALGKGRVLGRETNQTRELDNSGVLELQKQTMQDQDEDINTIADAVRRQKELAIQINEELAVQNEMLSILDEDATRVDVQIRVAKKKMSKIS